MICDGSVMFSLSRVTSPYLYPCLVQYCVLCIGVLITMWRNVTQENKQYKSRGVGAGDKLCGAEYVNTCQTRVDCNGSHAGLFCGVVMLVFTIVSLIMTFVFSEQVTNDHSETSGHFSTLMASVSDLVLYTVATIALLIGTCQIRLVKVTDN